MKKFLVLLIAILAVSSFATRCPKYNVGNSLPSYLEKEGYMVPVCPANFVRLGIMLRVDAIAETGKVITKSHGEIQNGQWIEIIDEQMTPEEIALISAQSNPQLYALKQALASEIVNLNTIYPSLNLNTSDTLITAIPKLFQSGVTKAEVNYLNTLYQAIKEASQK